jgi:hypothetical protein
MDGGLMAAKQTDYLSYIQIAGSGIQVHWHLSQRNKTVVSYIYISFALNHKYVD